MFEYTRRGEKSPGDSPGTLVYVGEKAPEPLEITRFRYNDSLLEETRHQNLGEIDPEIPAGHVEWINIVGLRDTAVLAEAEKRFGLHSLTSEDILNTRQRPKLDDMGDYLYLSLKMLEYDEESKKILREQLSLILGPDFVLTFQEGKDDPFEPVRDRLRRGRGRIRSFGPDYLFYSLLDAVVDNYFLILESLVDEIEPLEERVLSNPNKSVLQTLSGLKRKTLIAHKWVWPMAEMVNRLQHDDSPLIQDRTTPFLRDLHDHAVQINDALETARETLSSLFDAYVSGINLKMNEVMKVLTFIATLFIPLTFIAGLYGMNFRYMPELEWRLGYFLVLGLMAVLAGGMLWYFKKKNWW